MTREQKIAAIYKEMANKELTLGCYYCSEVTRQQEVYDWSIWPNYIVKIIWHPVMIGDVLDWVSGRIFDATKGEEDFLIDDGVDDVVWYDYKLFSMRSKISSAVNIRWNYKRLPIEKQTDRCIDFIYSLIKK